MVAAPILTDVATPETKDHERVVWCEDPGSGLRAVIAIHSTTLGPALGGTRFHPYATTDDALADALRLSRGMTYKNALAGMDLGGGKAVIIGDPERDKTEELLLAYGRCVAALEGCYITACDAGTASADMDVVARTSPFTVGRSEHNGGVGDSSVLTAYGVLRGMQAAARGLWGVDSLRGRSVGVAGVGKVGRLLVGHLVEQGATVSVTDVRQEAVDRVLRRHPGVRAVASTRELVSTPGLDVYAPCALGGAVDETVADVLTARIVCGAANNQLARPGLELRLAERGVLYMPDYVVNSGGVIQVAAELHELTPSQCRERAEAIYDVGLEVLGKAESDGVSTLRAADLIAEHRIASREQAPGPHDGRAGRREYRTASDARPAHPGAAGGPRERRVAADDGGRR
ncbi:Leu/Phe/Val dehydrogenase [Streptomyces sp. NPDC091272]|uniref:Leu/Phe/Val dehydrogenase n=1 Tax=Streptomyces sp. NPDC091272 TaxID=3365981 RepID=UPI0038020279